MKYCSLLNQSNSVFNFLSFQTFCHSNHLIYKINFKVFFTTEAQCLWLLWCENMKNKCIVWQDAYRWKINLHFVSFLFLFPEAIMSVMWNKCRCSTSNYLLKRFIIKLKKKHFACGWVITDYLRGDQQHKPVHFSITEFQ